MDMSGLIDAHCHTEFAYCATTVSAQRSIEISREKGLAGVCLTEHAFQLYFDQASAFEFEWQTRPELVEEAWRSGRGRMPAYRRFVEPLRSEFVHIGLELDLRGDGSLLLAPEDREGWDLLIGHIHRVPGVVKGLTGQAEGEKRFLDDIEKMLVHRIAVLAHPWRFLPRHELEVRPALFTPVARMLAEAGTAAELNFHYMTPNDPRFFEECLSCGVKIALGTDAHALEEVGDLSPHLEVLREIGVREADLPQVLYRPV